MWIRSNTSVRAASGSGMSLKSTRTSSLDSSKKPGCAFA